VTHPIAEYISRTIRVFLLVSSIVLPLSPPVTAAGPLPDGVRVAREYPRDFPNGAVNRRIGNERPEYPVAPSLIGQVDPNEPREFRPAPRQYPRVFPNGAADPGIGNERPKNPAAPSLAGQVEPNGPRELRPTQRPVRFPLRPPVGERLEGPTMPRRDENPITLVFDRLPAGEGNAR
jgi:hypothetical protein